MLYLRCGPASLLGYSQGELDEANAFAGAPGSVGRKWSRFHAEGVANRHTTVGPRPIGAALPWMYHPAEFEYVGERLHQGWWKPHAWLKTGAD